jgi:hypothetical protein
MIRMRVWATATAAFFFARGLRYPPKRRTRRWYWAPGRAPRLSVQLADEYCSAAHAWTSVPTWVSATPEKTSQGLRCQAAMSD